MADTIPLSKLAERAKYLQRWSSLQSERASFFTHWKELSQNVLPRSGRFFLSDHNRGEKKHNLIYDNTPTRALKTLAAGMQAGMTSPARPWFRLGTPDKDLVEVASVKEWLNGTTEQMNMIFQKSNTYRALHSLYGELGLYGSGCDIVVDNFKNVVHHHSLTVGEYCLAADFEGTVNTMYREFELQVSQVVAEFGIDNVSSAVKTLYTNGNLDAWIPIIHLIEPRKDRDPRLKDQANMAYASLYFETGCNENKFLRVGGFKSFDVLAPRWEVNSGDVYGGSPGMEALGDIKQLQHQQLRKGQAIDYKVQPPLQVPNSLKNAEMDMLPGGVSFYDPAGASGGIKTMFEVDLSLNELREDIVDVRQRINQAFYADLFLMISNDERSDITAREIAERHEEKLLMLGPVLERLNSELLDPLIDITFAKMLAAGIVAPPPKELQGRDLSIEYISMLAQAQRAVGTGAVDRLIGTVGAIAQLNPNVIDKLDADQIVDHYADLLGVDPSLIMGDDKVAIIRKQKQQAQAMQNAVAAAPDLAQTAQSLATARATAAASGDAALPQFSQG